MTMANPETMTLQQLQRVSLALTDAFFSSVALAAIFQGMFLVLAVEYYKRFGRNEGERMYMRVYVAALLVLSTVHLSLIITLIQNNGMLGMRPTLALTIQPWVLSAFCFLTEFFWVYRAVHVSQSRLARVVAAGLWVLAAEAFIAQAATVLQRRLNGDIAMREIYFADTVVCAAILVYELIWKRRQELAVSSPLQQFIGLALKTSLIIMVLVAIGAIATTHAFVSGDADSTGVAMAMPNIFPSASCCCIAVSLLQRQSLRASLEGGPSTRGFSNTSRPYPRHNTSLAEALNHISETAAWRGDVVQLSLARHGWEEEDAKETAVSPPRLPPTVSLPALYNQHTRSHSASRPSRACVGIRETVSTLAMRPCSQVWSRNVSFASSDQTPANLQFAVESITVSVKVEQQVQTENEETPEMEV
ncbi:hypothetical protein Rt10032_c02g1084 [Rhodotorula toruloides]|uniref:Uncharacterized protein n=1 Tax=Rhodotorula toruloides TaxID=5286 RepID=A0A511K9L3_RHOTO|nr:hypothetical protein Rt10032_c02g1084 [Rhodotorula toruloides]